MLKLLSNSARLSGSEGAAELAGIFEDVISMARNSIKFALPYGGVLFEDGEFRALGDDVSLSMPFDLCALEYEAADDELEIAYTWANSAIRSKKRVVFVKSSDRLLTCRMCFCDITTNRWLFGDSFAIDRTSLIGAAVAVERYLPFMSVAPERSIANGERQAAFVVFSFLNALSCANVRVDGAANKGAGKNVKAALQFDSYHILTVETRRDAGKNSAGHGPHRSPREHLRRGHVRRLDGGRRIWVNAAVVGAGRGAGVVKKDYAVRAVGAAGGP